MSVCFWEDAPPLLATWRHRRHYFFLFAGGQPDPQFDTDPVEPRNTPLSPLRGEGGFLPRPIWGDRAEFASVRAAQFR